MDVIVGRKIDTKLSDVELNDAVTAQATEFLSMVSQKYDKKALGLAAPQVGLDIRICALKIPYWIVAINPKIIETKGNFFETEEGCLTWPDKFVIAKRYSTITVEWYDETLVKHTEMFHGLQAIIWQHEIDHLDGVTEHLVDAKSVTRLLANEKVDRNEPCPCGSGFKFKKCCISLKNFKLEKS